MKNAKRILIIGVGIFFILLGLMGLVTPFLQGFLFLFIGLFLLSFTSPKIRFWIDKHTVKYPHLFELTKKIEKWMTKIIGEI
jgi:uncharacterized membrane protein YbaN (DUF454 family)